MTKQELIDRFLENHKEFNDYITSLEETKLLHTANGKWSAGQQLAHVYLCLVPINQALTSKDFIREKFGLVERPTLTYDQVISNYRTGLEMGGKAPERFLPGHVSVTDRIDFSEKLLATLHAIQDQLDGYSDHELDTLALPHPFLGMLSIRELLYLMTYHATHHLNQTQHNLKQ